MKTQKQESSLLMASQNILTSRLAFFREILWHHTFCHCSGLCATSNLEHREKELGFTLYRRRSTRHSSITVTDLDFADDLALISEEIYQAQMVLKRLEDEAENVGLFCNAKKTEAQIFNHSGQVEIKAKSGEILKNVENFKYLGAWKLKALKKTLTSEKPFLGVHATNYGR